MAKESIDQTIYLDVDDEITTVIDRLTDISAKNISIVVPKNAVVIQSVVNLKLLLRAANRQNKKIIIVSRDETGLKLALRAGIIVKERLTGTAVSPNQIKQTKPVVATIKEEPIANQTSGDELTESNGVSQKTNVQVRPSLRAMVEADRKVRDAKTEKSSIMRTVRPERTVPVTKSERTVPKVHSYSAAIKPLAKKAKVLPTVDKKNGKARNVVGDLRTKISLLPRVPWKTVGVSTLGVVVVAFLIMTFGFAKAEVKIKPTTEIAAIDFDVTARDNPDSEKKEVAGQFVTLSREGKKVITATAKKDKGEKASGSVTISNVFSDKPQTLAVGTRLRSAPGQIFVLAGNITVPGATVKSGKPVAGTTTATVEAGNIGEQYNVTATSFVFVDLPADKQAGITASSGSAMTGGSKKEITYLTAEDVETAKKDIQNELGSVLLSEMRAGLEEDQELLDGAVRINSGGASTSVAVGEEAQTVDFTMNVTAEGIVVKKEDITAAGVAELSQSLNDDQELLDNAKEEVSWQFKEINFDNKELVLTIHAEKKSAFKIDQDDLMASILGKSEKEAQGILEQLEEVTGAEVKLSPVWRSNLPSNPSKIDLSIDL